MTAPRARVVLYLGLPFAAAVAVVWRLLSLDAGLSWYEDLFAYSIVAGLVGIPVMAAVLVVTVVGARVVGGRAGPPWAVGGALSVSVAAGLLAVVPVFVTWHDGCNGHGGDVPLLVAPWIEHAKPERPLPVYGDISTAMACEGTDS